MEIRLTNDQELSLITILRQEWLEDIELQNVWITVFNVLGISQKELKDNPFLIDLGEIRIVILYGEISYFQGEMIVEGSDPFRFQPGGIAKDLPESCYLLIIQKFYTDGVVFSEEEPRKNMGIYSGLISVFFGINAVYRMLIETVINFRDQKWQVSSSMVRDPTAFPRPNISDNQIEFLKNAYYQLVDLPHFEKKRVELSLQWYSQAQSAIGGLDAFLKIWFAIEALGMDEKENIKKLNHSLANAYNITAQDAKNLFGLGKIYGFRNRIVHRGEIFPIELALIVYVEALFTDILFDKLKLPCERRAETITKNSSFDLRRMLYDGIVPS